jgi:hypothetical protein
MKTEDEVEKLEKIIGQLQGAHKEISVLAKKSPADSLNAFKLTLINNVIKTSNEVLGEKYKPFDHFDQFEADDLPSNSDVTMILAQYMEEAERYRSDNVVYEKYVGWVYKVDGKASGIQSGPPSKIGKK